MKLKAHLRDSPIGDLRAVAEFWRVKPEQPEVWEDAEQLVEHLYPRLQAPGPFKATFDSLEVSQREIVYFLALHGGELTAEEFGRRTGLHEPQKLAEMVERLKLRGFLWREVVEDEGLAYDLIGIPEPFVRLVDLPPYWKGFLGHYLQELGIPELKTIAQHALGLKFAGRKKQVLVHFIRERLLDPPTLRKLLEGQCPAERELFNQILQKNGACVWRDLLDAGAQKKFNHARAEKLEGLTQNSGLVYVWRAGANKYNNMVMVPRDLGHVLQNGFRRDERTLEELSRGTGLARSSRSAGAGQRPGVILDNTNNILRDLAIALAQVRLHKVKMLNNGGIGRNDLKKIVPLLSHNKTLKYAAFLASFAMSRKLLIPVGDQWRVSKTTEPWLADARQVYHDLYEFWLTTNEWNEEFVDGDVVHVDNYPQNLISITELRKLLLRVLEKMPIEAWIDFETFADSLLPQVAIEIPGRFEHAPNEKFNRHTALVIESVIAEPMYWLGLVTLGANDLAVARDLGSRSNESVAPYDVTQPLTAHLLCSGAYAFTFKPSATARALFGSRYLEPDRLTAKFDSGASLAHEAQHVTLQPNLEIVTPPDLNLARFYHLLAFCEVRKVDIMTTLALTRESLRMGMELGLTKEGILSFLRECSRRELPETAVQLIEECGQRHGEVDIGPAGGYIMAANPMHAEELRANPRIQRYVKDVFNERLILLDRTVDLRKVVRELQKMGFMPHEASETMHVTGEGLFHLTLRPEELYSLLALLQFAQGLEEEYEGPIFEGKTQALSERLGNDIKDERSPSYFIEPLITAFRKNFEKLSGKRKDDEKRKLRKQVTRLLTRIPRAKEPERYPGENPTSEPSGVAKMIKWAIEHEAQVKIHYLRSAGGAVDEVIEPESLQGDRLYAYCPDHDEHHIYAVKRVAQAAI